MAYATQSDIENRFGVDNVAQWSNLENESTTTDTARIAEAIAFADQEIDDRFIDSAYVVPLSASGTNGLRPVTGWAAALAGAWLFQSRLMRGNAAGNAETVMFQRRAALEEMDLYLAGCRRLSCARKTEMQTYPEIV